MVLVSMLVSGLSGQSWAAPTDSKVAGTIKAGQLKLWGRQGLVLFYKNFESSYDYTDLGEAVNPIDWEELLGDGNVTITFSK